MADIIISDKGICETIEYIIPPDDATEGALYLCQVPERYVLADDFRKDEPRYEVFADRESLAEAQKAYPRSYSFFGPCMTSKEFEWFKPFVQRYGNAFDRLVDFPWDVQTEIIDACEKIYDIESELISAQTAVENYVDLIERVLGYATENPESYDIRTILPLIVKALGEMPSADEIEQIAPVSGDGPFEGLSEGEPPQPLYDLTALKPADIAVRLDCARPEGERQ